MHTAPSSTTLVDALVSYSDSSRALRAASVLFLAALTAAAAQISVPLPFTQVPFTFQPMVVLLGGLALGPRLGLAAQVLYLAAGLAGAPVFAPSATLPPGALRLLGPTGGYLLSYPLAACLVGTLASRGYDRRYLSSVIALAAGLGIVYLSGATWLGVMARTVTGDSAAIGFRAALLTGVAPFIVADAAKLFLAAGIVPSIWALVGHDPRR